MPLRIPNNKMINPRHNTIKATSVYVSLLRSIKTILSIEHSEATKENILDVYVLKKSNAFMYDY